jgi:quercetin dioxygenase-like cupin family protein
VQERGGEVVVLMPGQTIYTPPGLEHWHGATSDSFMVHLAVWGAPTRADDPETKWGERVTDQEYAQGASAA